MVDPKTGFPTIPWYQYFVSPLIADINLSGATTDDLAEGEKNLYFTGERSYESTKSELKQGANVTLSYNDIEQTITINAVGSQLIGLDSISVVGAAGSYVVTLVNDQASPAETAFYGTSSSGTRGWQPMLGAFAKTGSIDVSAASNGVVSFQADLFYLQATR
jgi:Ca2+-binding RTX toxin-like protein